MTPLNPILNPPKKAAGPTSNGLSISPHPTVFLKSFRTFLICGEKIQRLGGKYDMIIAI